MQQSKTDRRIDALGEALAESVDGLSQDLREEVLWLIGRYRRLDRNLHKISRMSDRLQAEIMELNDQLMTAAVTDPLTGLANRRGAHETLTSYLNDALETGEPYCIALMDIDHFKAVNDTHGHDVGDEVLTEFAARLRGELKPDILSARWGGEEFLILFPNTDASLAGERIAAFLEGLRTAPMKTASGALTISASAGIAARGEGEDLESYDPMVLRADQALYAAKKGGRDRWVLADT